MTASTAKRRPSLAEDAAAMVDLHSTAESKQKYDEGLRSASRPLSHFERLCLGHTIENRKPRDFSRAEMRMAEINRLIEFRYGGVIPENDDPANGYLFAMACTIYAELVDKSDQRGFLVQWLRRAQPWVEDPAVVVSTVLAKMHPRGKHLRDRQAGKIVNLRWEERKALSIKTMSPADLTPLEFAKIRKEAKRAADRARDERKRRATGAKAQGASMTITKPWLAEGVSRATWYRRKHSIETVSSHACAISSGNGETDSSPLILNRIGREETVSPLASAPTLEPHLSDLVSGPGGGVSPPTRSSAHYDPLVPASHTRVDSSNQQTPGGLDAAGLCRGVVKGGEDASA